jgi:uncharacterized protein
MNQKEILHLLSENKSTIQTRFKVDKIALFGSYARDQQTDESDIDVYVEFSQKSFRNLAGLWNFLEELFHKKIDLFHKHKNNNKVIFDNIKKDLIYG